MPSTRPLISIVTPFFNEGEGVQNYYRGLTKIIDGLAEHRFEVICIDDGSQDDTLERLIAVAAHDPRFRVIELSRNFGKEAALTAGIDNANGNAVIPIDADLQDPPEIIPAMIDTWAQDNVDVVLARRIDRRTDSFAKRKSAEWFYRLQNRLSNTPIPDNVGDFRLMDRTVVEALKRLPERQRFMKGLFAWVGFKTSTLEFSRAPRQTGKTSFSGWKLWNFALEGFTSFSTLPLRVWSYIGGIGAISTFVYASAIILHTLINGIDVPGYASLLVAILFLGSLQLISVGLLGEYIGRIYQESKQRPIYLIRKEYGDRDAR